MEHGTSEKTFKIDGCLFRQSKKMRMSSFRPEYFIRFVACDKNKEGDIFLPFEYLILAPALKDLTLCKKVTAVIAPKFPTWELDDYDYDHLKLNDILPLTFPRISFRKIKDDITKFSLLLGYLAHPEFYNDDSCLTCGEYLPFVTSQKHRILPYVYKIDRPDLLQFYAERNHITKRNFEKVFLNPAIEANAVKCISYLNHWKQENLCEKEKDGIQYCKENGLSFAVTVSKTKELNTPLHEKKLICCDKDKIGDVFLPFDVIDIAKDAFNGCDHLTSILAPKYYTEKFDFNFHNGATIPLVFPRIDFRTVKNDRLKINLLLGYLAHPEYYEDCITGGFTENTLGEDYLEYVIRQKRRLLPSVFQLDRAEMIEFYAVRGVITRKNFDEIFLNPAKAVGAAKCVQFLKNWEAEYL